MYADPEIYNENDSSKEKARYGNANSGKTWA